MRPEGPGGRDGPLWAPLGRWDREEEDEFCQPRLSTCSLAGCLHLGRTREAQERRAGRGAQRRGSGCGGCLCVQEPENQEAWV